MANGWRASAFQRLCGEVGVDHEARALVQVVENRVLEDDVALYRHANAGGRRCYLDGYLPTRLHMALWSSQSHSSKRLRKRTDALDSWFEELQGLS